MEPKLMINKIIGTYEVLALTNKTKNNGHYRFIARCVICDRVLRNIRKETILKSYGRTTCHHNYTMIWKCKSLQNIYRGMIQRCYVKNDKSAKWYHDKGIRVCDEWLKDPQEFQNWVIKNNYKQGLSIDRIDPDKDYCPENCRWVSLKYNSKWKSTTNRITVNDITDSGKGWANRLHLGINNINRYRRLHSYNETCKYILKHMNS